MVERLVEMRKGRRERIEKRSRESKRVWPRKTSEVLIRNEVVGVAKWRIIRTIW